MRLGGSGKINWKSVASEDAPVKADSHRPAATRSRRKRKITGKKCEEAISRRSAATGEKKKKKKKHSETQLCKTAQRNGKVHTRLLGSTRRRRSPGVPGTWVADAQFRRRNTDSRMAAQGGERESSPARMQLFPNDPALRRMQDLPPEMHVNDQTCRHSLDVSAGKRDHDALSPARYTSLLERRRRLTPEKAQRAHRLATTTAAKSSEKMFFFFFL